MPLVTQSIVNGTLTGGSYVVNIGQTLQVSGSGPITTDAANIELGLGLTTNPQVSKLLSFDPASGTYRPLENTLATIAAGGVLDLMSDIYAGTVPLTVAGTMTLESDTMFAAPSLAVLAGGTVTGFGSITAPVVNDGVLGVSLSGTGASDLAPLSVPRALVVHGPVSGDGTLQISSQTSLKGSPLTLELDGAVSEGVTFQGAVGTLQLDQPSTFSGSIAGFTGNDSLILGSVPFASVTGYSYSGTASGGVLTINEGASSVALAFTGNYTTANFALATGAQASTVAITAVASQGGSTGGGGSGGGGTTGGATTVVIGGSPSVFGTGPVVAVEDLVTSNVVNGGLAPADPGSPSYLQWQFINAGTDGLAISTQAPNVFIHGGSGDDAIQVSSGQNVLDGGTGSNFETGGTGTDTFFTDARGASVVWNTVRNFHAGDAATLWGFTAGVSSYHWDPAPAGAAGYEGATLRANIVGGAGRTGDGIDASITFTGLSVAQAQKLQIVTGTQPAGSCLYIYNPGV